MKPSILMKLEQLAHRLEEVSHLLNAEEATANLALYTKLNKEYVELMPVVQTFRDYQQCVTDLQTATDMLGDADLKVFAALEIEETQDRQNDLVTQLQTLLLPKDVDDDKNVFLEIRAGTGGDEAALFAGDLLRMYTRFAERNRWQVEIVSESMSDLGGYREVIVRLIGDQVYSKLKFESGAHRVQRVPATETQGRIHTSACTVAILPEAHELSDVVLNPAELRIDTYRASGAGGQHINKTDSAVRVTHLPTGIVAECQDDRSQHKNKAKALAVLAARINDVERQRQQQAQATQRKHLVGSGDRSERIRTYNYPQGRLTDHRINLTLYKLDSMMDGDIFELTSALMAEHQAELLTHLSEA
ncbi:MAG: peptide chain release factor 1 [Neisseriaceae bacterium]|nr:peptide chain release factor 1 [Neisseriaceae bacterium]